MSSWLSKSVIVSAILAASTAGAAVQTERMAEPQATATPVDQPVSNGTIAADRGTREAQERDFRIVLPEAAPAQPAHVAELNEQILDRVRQFNGISGIAIRAVDEGWEAGWQEDRLMPQQSVSKLWVSLTVMDQVDRGEIQLGQTLSFDRNDVTLWSRSTASKILAGGYRRSVENLMFDALTRSDNHANDKLLRLVGGPDAVRATIRDKGLGPIRFGDGERIMQAQVAGLTWRQSYAYNNGFNRARAALPTSERRAAFQKYIDDPYDGAAASAIARTLARLEKGELLTPQSTAKMLTTMGLARTGRSRVTAGLARGWDWAHKTGTGQVFQGTVAGVNDVGILTAPDGTTYAMAILTVSADGQPGAQRLMQDITRMVIAHHDRYGRNRSDAV
ncbi:serine hydrolase [Sphingomicrobium sediminis]|uniref:beta-lactamase n=1 Tax=Sphingomicrobium sediminis TaxID=2950949 RepID=A0A9X2J3G8_9SPHN|nr:serine hydrolase [Sphingomicrobium sediminis]MCM8558040.1 class A beta-lactamase-related serine hydrolase [Sphingomicrobium sediminis]